MLSTYLSTKPVAKLLHFIFILSILKAEFCIFRYRVIFNLADYANKTKPIDLALSALFALDIVPVAQVSKKVCHDHCGSADRS